MGAETLWAKTPLILHIGLHKTATSWLQAHVFDNAESSSFAAYKDYKDIISHLIVPHENDFSAQAAADHFSSFVKDTADKNKIAVITAEALGGLPFHKRFVRAALAKRMADSFPGAKVLITIREQAAVILSIYGQFVRFGYHNSLTEFLAEPPTETGYSSILEYPYYDYVALLSQYEALFGAGNVVMAPFEIMTKNPQWLTEKLGLACHQDIAPPASNLGERNVNPADTAQARYFARQINRMNSRDLRWQTKKLLLDTNKISYWANRLVPKGAARNAKLRDITLIQKAIGDRYKDSNTRLAGRLGLDLKALGYKTER